MSASFASLGGLDLVWSLAALASTLGAVASALVLAAFDRRGIVVGLVALEIAALVLAPLLAWLDVHDLATRYGADTLTPLFTQPAIRAITLFAAAAAIANIVAITMKRPAASLRK